MTDTGGGGGVVVRGGEGGGEVVGRGICVGVHASEGEETKHTER